MGKLLHNTGKIMVTVPGTESFHVQTVEHAVLCKHSERGSGSADNADQILPHGVKNVHIVVV